MHFQNVDWTVRYHMKLGMCTCYIKMDAPKYTHAQTDLHTKAYQSTKVILNSAPVSQQPLNEVEENLIEELICWES